MEFSAIQPDVPLNTRGAHYLTFMVDDIDSSVKKPEEHGCTTMSQPLSYDEFGQTIQWCYVTDPNGIIFELTSAAY